MPKLHVRRSFSSWSSCVGAAQGLHQARRLAEEMMTPAHAGRTDLEECLDYLAIHWQEDLDVPPGDLSPTWEPLVFEEETAWRARSGQCLTHHRGSATQHPRASRSSGRI
jgi:hypothetical protein